MFRYTIGWSSLAVGTRVPPPSFHSWSVKHGSLSDEFIFLSRSSAGAQYDVDRAETNACIFPQVVPGTI